MGCDIYAIIEYKEKNVDEWRFFNRDPINLDRDYSMFAAMANVRNYHNIENFKPKGIPEDASYPTVDANSFLVIDGYDEDSRCVNKKDAEKWVEHGRAKWLDKRKSIVSNPETHRHSYLNAEEFGRCINVVCSFAKYVIDPQYIIVLEMLNNFNKLGYESRIVFWFDN